MKFVRTSLVLASLLIIFSSCGGGGGGSGDGVLSGDGTISGGGNVPGGSVSTPAPYQPPAGVDVPPGTYVYNQNEVPNKDVSTDGVTFDQNGRVVGMAGIPYNPCRDKACAEKRTADTPEFRKRTSIDWAKVRK